MKRGKKYQEAFKKIDQEKNYGYSEALALVKEIAFSQFDETVEVSVKLNLKKSHIVRDTVILPHLFMGEKRILVFAKGEKADEAKMSGATYVGENDLIEKIRNGWMDFDVCVATPDMMKEVGRLGPVLGRRGLMPNPKTGTITYDLASAIKELKAGRIEFRSDKTGVVHLPVGKVSMDVVHVYENLKTFMSELNRKRPADLKGEYIRSVAVCSTMGPGIRVQFKETRE